VECVATWGDKLIVGCSEGALLVLGAVGGGGGGGGRMEIVDSHKVASRKAVTQVRVLVGSHG
jgi:hypothetical protein